MNVLLQLLSLLSIILAVMIPPSSAQDIEGMIRVESNYSVETTLDRLEQILSENGLTLFTRINFSRDAQTSGLTMHDAELLVFGNPKVGTPIIVESPTIAIDLPLKALAWEDSTGTVFLAWNDPAYLAHRHGVGDDLVATFSGIRNLLMKAVE